MFVVLYVAARRLEAGALIVLMLLCGWTARLNALPIPTPTGAMASDDDRKLHGAFASVFAFASILAMHACFLFLLRVRGMAAIVLWSTTTLFLFTYVTTKRYLPLAVTNIYQFRFVYCLMHGCLSAGTVLTMGSCSVRESSPDSFSSSHWSF